MFDFLDEHLKNKIVPFWNRQRDSEHGGYYGYAEINLVTNKYADKGSVKIARILWAYSALSQHYNDTTYLEYAKFAYDYLMGHLYDNQEKGVFWKSSYSGAIINSSKHIYAQGFAIYGLSEYYLASGDCQALKQAMEIFNVIEEKAYHPMKNVYFEQFDRNWNKTSNTLLADDGQIPGFTTNSILHLIEAYTSLYLVSRDVKVRKCLSRLLDIFYDKIYCKASHRCLSAFDEDWNVIDNSISYGHDIESSWLLDRAMDSIGRHPYKFRKMTHELCENSYAKAYSEGMIESKEANGIQADALVWWVQAEAVVGFLNHYSKTQNMIYLNAAEQTLNIIMTKIVDQREGGEWFWSVDRSGKPFEYHGISENWKANYHNVRMCLEVLRRGRTS